MAYNLGLRPFRFWCQQVLPLVYDDSLSYMELLSKVIYRLNELQKKTQEGFDNLSDDIESIRAELQEIWDNIPTDISDMVNKLKEEIEKEIALIDGKVQEQFNELETQLNAKIEEGIASNTEALDELRTELRQEIQESESAQNTKIDEIKQNLEAANQEFQTSITNQIQTLETYMNNYFNNLDLSEELDNALDRMVTDGSLGDVIKPYVFAMLTPEFVDSEDKMTDTSKVYILTTNNHIYQYRNGAWVDTGLTYGYAPNTMEGYGEDFTDASIKYPDLNALVPNRIYYYNQSQTITHAPYDNFKGRVIVFSSDVNSKFSTQFAVDSNTNTLYIRQKINGTFGEWTSFLSGNSDDSFVNYTPEGHNANVFIKSGFYILLNEPYTGIPTGLPNGNKLLLVFKNKNNLVYQILFMAAEQTATYIRFQGANGTWSNWFTLTADISQLETQVNQLIAKMEAAENNITAIQAKNTQQDSSISAAQDSATQAATTAASALAKAEEALEKISGGGVDLESMKWELANAFFGSDAVIDDTGVLNAFSWDYIGTNRQYQITENATSNSNIDPLPGTSPFQGLVLSFGPYTTPAPDFAKDTQINSQDNTVLYFHYGDSALYMVTRRMSNGVYNKPSLSSWVKIGGGSGGEVTLPNDVMRTGISGNITEPVDLFELQPNRIYYISGTTVTNGPIETTITGFVAIFTSLRSATPGAGMILLNNGSSFYLGKRTSTTATPLWIKIPNENSAACMKSQVLTANSDCDTILIHSVNRIDSNAIGSIKNKPPGANSTSTLLVFPVSDNSMQGCVQIFISENVGVWIRRATSSTFNSWIKLYPADGLMISSTSSVMELNNYTTQGSFRISASTLQNALHAPEGKTGGGAQLEVFCSDTYIVQLFAQPKFYAIRFRDSTLWNDWVNLSGNTSNTVTINPNVVTNNIQNLTENLDTITFGSESVRVNDLYGSTTINGKSAQIRISDSSVTSSNTISQLLYLAKENNPVVGFLSLMAKGIPETGFANLVPYNGNGFVFGGGFQDYINNLTTVNFNSMPKKCATLADLQSVSISNSPSGVSKTEVNGTLFTVNNTETYPMLQIFFYYKSNSVLEIYARGNFQSTWYGPFTV